MKTLKYSKNILKFWSKRYKYIEKKDSLLRIKLCNVLVNIFVSFINSLVFFASLKMRKLLLY